MVWGCFIASPIAIMLQVLPWFRACTILFSNGLVADPGKRLLAAKGSEHVEDSRRCRAAGQRGPERLGQLAELQPPRLGKGFDSRFKRRRAPLRLLEHRQKRFQRLSAL